MKFSEDPSKSNNEAILKSKPRILVVEDDEINQHVIVNFLEKLGYVDVVVKGNGLLGLKAWESSKFDLILMDCQMPEMDGYEAATNIRAQELKTGEHIPIIAVTAHAMKGDKEKCLKAGMDDYTTKPLDIRTLEEIIQKCLKQDDASKVGEAYSLSAPMEEIEEHAPEIPIINLDHLRSFTGGDKDIERELFGLFIASANEALEIFDKSYDDDDKNSWRSIAHRLKGSSANLGANQLADVCYIAEQGFELPQDTKKNILEDIKLHIDNVKNFISSEIGGI